MCIMRDLLKNNQLSYGLFLGRSQNVKDITQKEKEKTNFLRNRLALIIYVVKKSQLSSN